MGESMVVTSWNDGDDKVAKSGLEVSVSFGRFENDSTLSWEKWSTFSPNKYLEEVEKYATPGSVAQKKAYFEAHYKKIAARKAAELLEQQPEGKDDKFEEDQEGNGCDDEFHVSCGGISDPAVKQCESENEHCCEEQQPPMEEPEIAVKEEKVKMVCKPESSTNAVTKQQKADKLLHQQKKISQKVATRTSNVKDTPIGKKKMAPCSPAIQRPQNTTTPRAASKLASTSGTTLSSSSRLSTANKANSNVATKTRSTPRGDTTATKRVAPKALHLSINVDTLKSDPQPRTLPVATSARKSLIMETMGDKDIVRRAFKTFQSGYNRLNSSSQQSTSGGAKQVPSTRPEVQVSVTKTPRKENGGSYKAGDADKRYAKAAPSSFGSKSEERADKRKEFLKKLEGKPNAKEAESALLRTKSKDEKDAEIKKLRQSLNFKATPLPGLLYRGHKVAKSSFDKESSKTLQI